MGEGVGDDVVVEGVGVGVEGCGRMGEGVVRR
jgi:hypothetical protein